VIRCSACRGKGKVLGGYDREKKANPTILCSRCKGTGKEPSRADCEKRKIFDIIGRATGILRLKKCRHFDGWNLDVYHPSIGRDLKKIDEIIDRVAGRLRSADPGEQNARSIKRGMKAGRKVKS